VRMLVAWTAAAALAGASSAPASAQSLRLGDHVRIAPTARLHADVRRTDADDGEGDVDLDLARRRVGVRGRVTSRVEFEVERELDSTGRWRDAFVNVRASRALQLRAGHFKLPFSREQLTGAGSLDFIDRSRAADVLGPGRGAGLAVHGRVLRRSLGYEAGVFTGDGTRRGLASTDVHEPAVAARVTFRLRGSNERTGSLTDLELGAAAVTSKLLEGRASLRGRLTTNDLFFAPVLVSGRRLRVGGDLDWRPGPFGVRAEFLRADDARQHQGLLGETLPALRATGWYVSGAWAVAGRRAHATANDRLAVAGVAGLELAVRTERLSFGTAGAAPGQVWTPRAEQVSLVTDQVWTVGANWTLNRLVRLQVNAVRESVVDRSRGVARPRAAWSPVARVQVAM
jgi:phosphate-selective porin